MGEALPLAKPGVQRRTGGLKNAPQAIVDTYSKEELKDDKVEVKPKLAETKSELITSKPTELKPDPPKLTLKPLASLIRENNSLQSMPRPPNPSTSNQHLLVPVPPSPMISPPKKRFRPDMSMINGQSSPPQLPVINRESSPPSFLDKTITVRPENCVEMTMMNPEILMVKKEEVDADDQQEVRSLGNGFSTTKAVLLEPRT